MCKHFFNNLQCKKIFFVGCHDKGYLHDLRGYAGNLDAKERIVLVETTPAEPGFGSLGFCVTRFDAIFRSEHLRNERKAPLPPSASVPPSLSEHPIDNARQPRAAVSASSNGGISVRYSSYAAVGGASSFQNISIQVNKDRPKIIQYNQSDYRLDPPRETYSSDAKARYHKKRHEIFPKTFCNSFYLTGSCRAGCERDHDTKLTSDEISYQPWLVRGSMCANGPTCDDYSCYFGHHCPFGEQCTPGTTCRESGGSGSLIGSCHTKKHPLFCSLLDQ